MSDINNMNRDELIKYAIDFNIFKQYDFPEYVDTKNAILQKMNELNISMDEVNPAQHRIIDRDYFTSTINIYRK